MRRSIVRAIAVFAALVGWMGLALQLWLLVSKLGVAAAVWHILGFFTILTNIGAASVATAIAIGRDDWLSRARARLMVTTSIVMVGLVYSVALRALWNPTGLQGLADEALHDIAPLTWLLLWLVAPHPRLAWREIGWALLPPVSYVIYAMARGAIEGWYAYWFLNPATQSRSAFVLSLFILICGFAMAAGALVAVDRVLGRRRPAPSTA